MPLDPVFSIDNKTVWIAGETGLVGSALSRKLAAQDCTIISAPHSNLDLTNQAQTLLWLKNNKPDVVIMCAGKVGGIGANASYPADFLYQNLAMVQHVIHGSYLAGVQKLLYLGSSCIYPKHAAQPIKESALLSGDLEQTNEAYALAKISGLKLCEFYRLQYGCDFISAMPTNLYGPHDHFDANNSHVIPAMILKFHQAKTRNKQSMTLWGSGKPLREFLYIDDLADGLLHVLQHYSHKHPINIGSGHEISIHDLALMIRDITTYSGEIIFDPTRPDGTPRKLLDNTKMNKLGWTAQTSLKTGLEKTYQWFLENYDDQKSGHLAHG